MTKTIVTPKIGPETPSLETRRSYNLALRRTHLLSAYRNL